MSNPSCGTCGHQKPQTIFLKREDGSWSECMGWCCHSPEALKNHTPNKSGGIPIGRVCWTCRGDWWVQ